MTALLTAENVTKNFGGLTAVNQVSLSLEAGQIVGLIGPNGAGKTTLFHCLAGFSRPERGRIALRGRSIRGWSPSRVCHAGIARTFQIPRVFEGMSVLENVMVGVFARRASRPRAQQQARRILERCGLLKKENLQSYELTVADKKRLELARALATSPQLLMLDEVMCGLTQPEQQEAMDLIRNIRDEGIAVLMVEHVMEVILPLSQSLIVMVNGSKVAEGPPRQVIQQDIVVEAYLGSANEHPRSNGTAVAD